jgi:hypothetical protein
VIYPVLWLSSLRLEVFRLVWGCQNKPLSALAIGNQHLLYRRFKSA